MADKLFLSTFGLVGMLSRPMGIIEHIERQRAVINRARRTTSSDLPQACRMVRQINTVA